MNNGNVFIYWNLIVFNRLVVDVNNMELEMMTNHFQLMLVVGVRGTSAISPCLSSNRSLRQQDIAFKVWKLYICIYIYIYKTK